MLREHERTQLLDAMMLLEIADRMYPAMDHFFSRYTSSELIAAAHDLIQSVHDGEETQLEKATRETLATLEAARRYVDMGGHLLNASSVSESDPITGEQRPPLLRRIIARVKTWPASAA